MTRHPSLDLAAGRSRRWSLAACLLCVLCASGHAATQDAAASPPSAPTAHSAPPQVKDNALAAAKAAHAQHDYLGERQLLAPLAEGGNAEAQAMLGFLYRFGLGVAENHAESVAWFRKAAAQGDAWAQQNYGAALLKGDGVEPDIAQGIALLQQAGDHGSVSAYGTLGGLYLQGKSVTKNRDKGLAYYAKAANGGDALSSFQLGSLYEQGVEVPLDFTKAAFWYGKGAELGFFMCQYNLGRMYAGGVGVPLDLVEAYKWAELAAKSGPPDATVLVDYLRPKLSATQLAKAERLVSDWQATHQSRKWQQL